MIYSDYWYQKRLKLSLNIMTGAMTGAPRGARRGAAASRPVHVARRVAQRTHNEPSAGHAGQLPRRAAPWPTRVPLLNRRCYVNATIRDRRGPRRRASQRPRAVRCSSRPRLDRGHT